MNIRKNTASRIQHDVYIVTIDETATSVIGIASGNNINDWIYAVNLIYRCLASEIWTTDAAPYMPSWLAQNNIKNNYEFCKKLSEYNPFLPEKINMKYWLEPLICNTHFGQNFIESFGLKNLEKDEAHPPFINSLEKLFHEKGIPWEAGDLFGMGGRLE